MSRAISPSPQKRYFFRFLWLIPLLGVGALAFLAFAYYGVGFLLVRQVDSLYTARDCVNLVQQAEYIGRFYPSKIASFTDRSQEQAIECEAYLTADSLFEKQDWKAAHEAYLAYRAAYPNGIYNLEAHNLAAEALFQIAAEQRSRQDFAGAVDSLKLLASEFHDTPALQKTNTALPEVYLDWGQGCRAEQEFTEAETVYLSLTTWAEQENDQAYTNRAQTELAQTYFDWGMALESEKKFSQAAAKFDSAIQTDPASNSMGGIAANTRTHLPDFQRTWGMHLITQKKYAEAIQHYELSVTLSPSQDMNNAKDQLAQAYLGWAESLRSAEDFHQALEKIEDSQNAGASTDSKKKSEEAYADTLSLFSESKGSQAQQIIADASNSICKNGKPLETLPIIGILDEKRLALSGVTLTLPAAIQARTPGSLHFAACAEEKEIIAQNCPYSRTGYGIMTHWIKRIRYEWQIKVYDVLTGKLVNQRTFQGSAPKYCPRTYSFGSSNTAYFRGDKPSASTVTDWLASLLK